MKLKIFFAFVFLSSFSLFAEFAEPFDWSIDYSAKNGQLAVKCNIPADHYLYQQSTILKVTVNGKDLAPSKSPEVSDHKDDFGIQKIYHGGGVIKWIFSLPPGSAGKVKVDFQGCRDKGGDEPAVCFMPATKEFSFGPEKKVSPEAPKAASNVVPEKKSSSLKSDSLEKILDDFKVLKTGGGYLPPKEFLSFLSDTNPGSVANSGDSLGLADKSMIGLILFILIGGMLLNLTPCVLPMIPINLAIIGAGTSNNSKASGFIRGGIYGAGIAIAYGALGLVTVLTGAKFGSLNSSPLFNFIIAIIFIFLALAMFDIVTIDFSKYSAKLNPKSDTSSGKGALFAVFAMGIVAALLAGACVAPVVIAVLLYSTTMYTQGSPGGILLPFLLGIGMALPWPLAGGGMSVLPKPGAWMVKVKYVFGVLIILFAGYYAYTGITLIRSTEANSEKTQIENLVAKLQQAKAENKPVFIDFWATWCKNCLKMNSSTFKDPAVKKRMEEFVEVKFQAEDVNSPKIRKLLDRYKIPGLPGYVILKYNPETGDK